MDLREVFEFYKGKKVLVTGHTGFKGAWLSRILINAGAEVTGYSLEPPTAPDLFSMAGLEGRMDSVIGDIRDLDHLKRTFEKAQPELVLISCGKNNRYGHPAPETLKRLEERGIRWYSTAEVGAIQVHVGKKKVKIETSRIG